RDTSWPALLRRIVDLDFRAAICGPQGSGKTTLLETLARTMANSARRPRLLQLRRETRSSARRLCRDFLDSSEPDDLLLLDGAEQLGPLAWRHFQYAARRCRGLIITAHTPGRLPTLINCSTTPALLESIVAELIPHDYDRWKGELPALFARHRGNIRDCLRELYDHYCEDQPSTR
ncbi:MAG: hypothetical protein U0992_25565, partial [Planctomycetaceae bacterium]